MYIGNDFVAPQLNWALLLPFVVIFGTAIVGVLFAAFMPRSLRWGAQVALAATGLIGTLVTVAALWPYDVLFAGDVFPDGSTGTYPMLSLFATRTTIYFMLVLLVLALVAMLMMAERTRGEDPFVASAAAVPGSEYEQQARNAGLTVSEVFPLMLFAVGGMMAFIASGDLLTMFVALEVFSLPLYILCGLSARRRLMSQEASLKYFLLGAFASALFLFGIAVAYMLHGAVDLVSISQVTLNDNLPVFYIVMCVLLFIGPLFKVGAAPFHSWTPDVYEGAPTPVTAFMAACTKVAAFAVLFRMMMVFGQAPNVYLPILITAAVLSMVIGVLVALQQNSMKRILAYSSVAHAGFILTALTAVNDPSLNALMFYVATYGVTTLATFAVVSMVRERTLAGDVMGEAYSLEEWRGLGQRAPFLAGSFAFLLLATAGIPLTSGFMGKFLVFRAAWANGFWWLALVGVLASAVAAFFYLRIIAVMYSRQPDQAVGESTSVSVVWQRPLTLAVLVLGLLTTAVLGVYPQPLLDVIAQALIP